MAHTQRADTHYDHHLGETSPPREAATYRAVSRPWVTASSYPQRFVERSTNLLRQTLPQPYSLVNCLLPLCRDVFDLGSRPHRPP